jgi:hypothetical protein
MGVVIEQNHAKSSRVVPLEHDLRGLGLAHYSVESRVTQSNQEGRKDRKKEGKKGTRSTKRRDSPKILESPPHPYISRRASGLAATKPPPAMPACPHPQLDPGGCRPRAAGPRPGHDKVLALAGGCMATWATWLGRRGRGGTTWPPASAS